MTAPTPSLPSGASDVPPLAGRREWIGLSVLALACLLYVMDLTVLHLAVPAISEDLHPTSTQLLWIIDIYGFMVAGFLVTMGTLGDRIGRRRVLLIGAAAFGVTSLAAAFSTTAEMLIISRAALGIAGATIAPSTLSLIFSMFRDPRQRSLAVGVWISAFSAGSAIGPVIGGVLLEHFAWGSVFLLALPVMVALLILGPIVLPEYKDPDAGRLDLLSAGLSLVAVLSVVFGLKQAAMEGFTPTAIGAIALGLAVGLAFVRRQLRLTDPMLDLSLFRIPAFSASLAVNFLTVFVAIGYFLFVAQYLQLVLGLSPFQAGIWSVPSAIGFIVGSNLAPRLFGGVRPAYLIAGCLGVASVGLLILAQAGAAEGLVPVVVASVVISLGLAPVFGLTTELIVGSAPPEKAGAASGVSETGSELGGALGISILGSIGLAVYRGQTDGALPEGLPDDAVAVAVDTLGGAVSVAAELPAAIADQVLAVARGAYVDGMQLVALISVVLAAGVAAFALLALRGIQRPDGGETGGGHGAAAGPDDDARPVITAVPAPEG
jgi:DHA2 family multidrug resistance protein-like MFS transporter